MPQGCIARICAKLFKPGQSEVEHACAEIQDLETYLSNLQSQLNQLSTLKADAEAGSRDAAAELTRAEADSAEAEHALKPLQAEFADLQQQLSDAVSAFEAVKGEQTTASDQAAHAQSSLLQSAAQMAQMTADQDTAATSRDQAQLQDTRLQEAVTSLQQQLTNAQQALDASQAELTSTNAQLSQAGVSRQNLPQDLTAVQSRQQASVQRSEELQRLLGGACQQLVARQHKSSCLTVLRLNKLLTGVTQQPLQFCRPLCLLPALRTKTSLGQLCIGACELSLASIWCLLSIGQLLLQTGDCFPAVQCFATDLGGCSVPISCPLCHLCS